MRFEKYGKYWIEMPAIEIEEKDQLVYLKVGNGQGGHAEIVSPWIWVGKGLLEEGGKVKMMYRFPQCYSCQNREGKKKCKKTGRVIWQESQIFGVCKFFQGKARKEVI